MIELYHGTSKTNAEKIEVNGFNLNACQRNWTDEYLSRPGFIYLSSAYALYYAQATKETNLALIKCSISEKDIYPDEDFMIHIFKNKFSPQEINRLDADLLKDYGQGSLKYLGCACARPEDVEIIGVRYFSDNGFWKVSDPCITLMNFHILGGYYKWLSDKIYEGFSIEEIIKMKKEFDSNEFMI